ncbi:hypothetical protein TWF217_009666 [Orbilia oligospora]|nr:hypothetical protein TWF217_009666 [Orbilia oligospora]
MGTANGFKDKELGFDIRSAYIRRQEYSAMIRSYCTLKFAAAQGRLAIERKKPRRLPKEVFFRISGFYEAGEDLRSQELEIS